MCGRAGKHGTAVGQFGHDGTVVVTLYRHETSGDAAFFQTAAHGVCHGFSRVPHCVVNDEGSLLWLLFGHGSVTCNDVGHGLCTAMDETVIRGDHVDIEFFHHGQGFEYHGRIGQHYIIEIFFDAVVIFAIVSIFVAEAHGAGDVLTKNVVADEQFFFWNVGDHAVGPVQHARFLKDDIALANADAVTTFHCLYGPILHVREVSSHGFETGLRHENFFWLAAFHKRFQRACMIQLHMVTNDIINLFRWKHLGHTAQQRSFAARVHSVHEDILFVFN